MRRFLYHITLFCLPLLVGLVILYWIPRSDRFRYESLLASCERGDFLNHRIFERSEAIDIAFLGTSMTVCGIDDRQIEKMLSEQREMPIKVANLGFCRPGRSLHLAILKDLLTKHHPQLIILEVRFQEDRFSHKDFPALASTSDLWSQAIPFNQRYFEGLETGTLFRLAHHRNWLMNIPLSSPDSSQLRSHTYQAVSTIADPGELDWYKGAADRKVKAVKLQTQWDHLNHWVTFRYPLKTMESIAKIVQEADIPLIFLYLKSYGHPAQEPTEIEKYRQLGPIWVPPDSIFQNPSHFFDKDHLNQWGAKALSTWLGKAVDEMLVPQNK